MRQLAHVGTMTFMLACVAGCGKISFGVDLIGPDAGPPSDSGPSPDVPDVPPVVDTGMPDAGPEPDVGMPDGGEPECLPVTLPPTPVDWPFGTDRRGYEAAFWTWANATENNCAMSACHGGDKVPYMPTGADLGAQYRRGINEVWGYLRTEDQQYSGRVWRHHANYDGPDGPAGPTYTPQQVTFLKDLLQAAWACAAAPAIASQDAGPLCGPGGVEPDSGAPQDAGGLPDAGPTDASPPDAGPVDAGPVEAGTSGDPCYCDLPDVGSLNIDNCAP